MISSGALIWIAAAVALVAVLWPRAGLLAQALRWRRARGRMRVEDALKHLLASEHRGTIAGLDSLRGALGLGHRPLLRLVRRMEAAGLLQSQSGGFVLTPSGERLALHVVRAHRLWERYLADEAGMAMSRIHRAAEREEHRLSAEALDALDAHLGHPQHDPHGDPIPAADGRIAQVAGVPLTDWPAASPARIVHLEDEPEIIFKQIVAAGLRPGMTVRVLESGPERLVVSDGRDEHRLAPAVAANIQVAAPVETETHPAGAIRLSELAAFRDAEVTGLDPECRGFVRRRLLDLGLTPGARVRIEMTSAGGDPRAVRVRGTIVALRREQARGIWVLPAADGTSSGTDGDATRRSA